MGRDRVEVHKHAKKQTNKQKQNEANIEPSLPNKHGQFKQEATSFYGL